MSVGAVDVDGQVSKVEFYSGATLLGTVPGPTSSAASYTFTWANAPAGTHSLTARATDSHGAVSASAAIAITVVTLPPLVFSGPLTEHLYNGAGQRTVRVQPEQQSVYVYGQEGHTVLAEVQRNLSNSVLTTTEHIYLPTASGPMPVAVVLNGAHYAVHTDHLNTPRRLTNSAGQPVWQWAFSGFGELPAQALPPAGQAAVSFNLRFPGQVDDGNGLFYNWHRFYDPSSGRYVSSDPIGLEGGFNRFGYVGGNPLNGSDPSGLIDSLNARVLALAAQGDLQGAIFLAQTAGGSAGAMALATRLQQLQTSVQALTARYPLATNRCVDVAEGIAEAAKTANLTPQFLRIAPSQTPFVYIGDRYTAVQHFAVRFGDRVFDAYTGAQGMLYGQYINMLNSSNLGSGSYVIQNIQTLAPYK